MTHTCKKCQHAVIVDGDELYCPRCGWIGYLPAPEKPVPPELKADPKFQRFPQKGKKHEPRLCHVCERVVYKPTKHADLCVDCMRWLHAWLKNRSHLKPPPYIRLTSGRWWPNPFRVLHHKIVTSTDFESILSTAEQLLEVAHGLKNTPLPPAPTAAKTNSSQQPGRTRPELAAVTDGPPPDTGRVADGRRSGDKTDPAGRPKYPRRYTSNTR